jgi:hypothetical protein
VVLTFSRELLVLVFGAGSDNHSGSFFILFYFNFPFCKLPRFSEFKKNKIQLSDFQGQWVLKNFEPLVFKGDSHKLVIINQGFYFILFYFFGFFLCFFSYNHNK